MPVLNMSDAKQYLIAAGYVAALSAAFAFTQWLFPPAWMDLL